jgi:glucose/arabinose dehydrogenase
MGSSWNQLFTWASATIACGVVLSSSSSVCAAPAVLDPGLQVTPVVSGLNQPSAMAFLGPDDFFVLEKASGQVKRVANGVIANPIALDLSVNSASERGLLSIALAPSFPADPSVYLFWTESATGADTSALAETPLLGNRIDRFLWNGTNLILDKNIAQFRARQNDGFLSPGQPERGNHNGGVMAFGPDGKLYVEVGDVGRRGWMQNLPTGPFTTSPFVDDQFGGPEPDNAHHTSVVVRLNPDGTVPSDNPFFAAGAAIGGEMGANVQETYAYGHRNSFGMAFDPSSGQLWMSENGDDSFDELNRVTPAMNGGWTQIMGPSSRIAQFKEIETNEFGGSLQQPRWSPSQIADTEAEALARLFMLPGAEYSNPEFSWKYNVAPSAIGFLNSAELGAQYSGDLFVGASTPNSDEGFLLRFNLTADRQNVDVSADPRLADRVADNLTKHDLTESETLRFGTGFGITTSILTSPDGKLYVVSLSQGTVYQIAVPEPATLFLLAGAVPWLPRRRMSER